MTVRVLNSLLLGLAAFLLLALMMITVIDVIGRYLLDAPLSGAFEMTELTLGALVFMALPLVSRAGAHVEVDLVAGLLPAAANRALSLLAAVVAALVLLFFAWQLGELGIRHVSEGSRSVSLEVPFAPFAFLGCAACVLSAVLGVLRELGHD